MNTSEFYKQKGGWSADGTKKPPLCPNSFPALKIGDDDLPKGAKKRQKAPFAEYAKTGAHTGSRPQWHGPGRGE